MTDTISLALVNELFDHHYWARDRQLQACVAVPQSQFLRSMGSSFPSLRDTLAHLVAAEWIWLERWRGHSPRALLSPQEFPTLADIDERWRLVEYGMRRYLSTLTEETLDRPVTYINPAGESWTYSLPRMMLHLLQHQSYHRGQVATLLRQLGIQPPGVDFLVAHDMGFRL